MTPLRAIGYAKINLALHVRRRRDDGYHDIETLFAFAEDGDALSFAPGEEGGLFTLAIDGPFATALAGSDDDDNLILRAARGFAERVQAVTGGHFHLTKALPVAAGIGGGSADAAAALRLLARLADVAPDAPALLALAAELGADVPACLASASVRGDARGDALRPVADEALRGMPLLLVNPRVPLATGPVFAGWDRVDRGPLAKGAPLVAALAGRNDLEPPARALVPAISAVVGLLAGQPGVRLARMSGSGATCFALFEDDAARDAADAAIGHAEPGWWRLPTRLR